MFDENSKLSQSEVSTSDEHNNLVNDISVKCDNLVNNNNILDECNNLINKYKNSLVNKYEYNLVDEYNDNLINNNDNNLINDDNNNWVIEDNQDNILHSILQSQPKKIC
ncbi:hypothetical protein F8M41_010701 [Gigaspora margarita]|uniref:Uncharacterized protein n=1 Tax=Gigaspora margarita TaxID=4874 RepID=A0A8H4A296_GIGMA|nr:hypothetical protein F8M41_010701 [Gigaspora margarita]